MTLITLGGEYRADDLVMTLRTRQAVISLLGIVAALLAAPRVHAQSFDCRGASTVVEKAICKDKSIGAMDSKLAQAFREALGKNADHRSDLVASERRWLALRGDQCGAYFNNLKKMNQCLGYVYGKRISEIEAGHLATTDISTGSIKGSCDNVFDYGLPIEAADLPRDVAPFVPVEQVAIQLACADLTGDGQPGYLLVTYSEKDLSRRLQLLLTMPDGSVTAVVATDRVIQAKSWDGVDGSYKLIGRREGFEVIDASLGTGGGDTYTFNFHYSPADGTWLLTRAQKKLIGSSPTFDDHEFVQGEKDFGRVSVQNFDLKVFARQ